MKAKIDVISGFLGAGKTTFIKKLLDGEFLDEKVVVIENEFGEATIDSAVLSQSNIKVTEISAGCICCTLAYSFNTALVRAVEDLQADRIIIEPSGVASLSDIINIVEAPNVRQVAELNMVITIIDVVKYELYIENFNTFYEDQIRNSRTILLNRTQGEVPDKINRIVASLRTMNEHAVIVSVPWEDMDAGMVFSAAALPQAEDDYHIHGEHCSCGCSHGLHEHSHEHHEASHPTAADIFDVFNTEVAGSFSEDVLLCQLRKVMDTNAYGRILRGKGILHTHERGWLLFDCIPGEITTKEFVPGYSGRVSFIGTGLDRDALGKLFQL